MLEYTSSRIISSLSALLLCRRNRSRTPEPQVKLDTGWSPKLIPKFVSTECDISFPSLPCHPYALQFCPPHGLPVGFATTTHSSKGQKRTVLTCFKLPCCTLHFFQGSNWYTSDVKSANQEKTLTLLYLHHSYYTVNIPWIQTSFGSAALQSIFSVHLCKGAGYKLAAATFSWILLAVKPALPHAGTLLCQDRKLLWLLFAFQIHIPYCYGIFKDI